MRWDDAAWDDLVGDLYLSAIDRDARIRLPGRFAALTGGGIASLWRIKQHDSSMVDMPLTNLPAEGIAAYLDHYHQHDPLNGVVMRTSRGSMLRGADFIDDAALTNSIYYNEFGVRHGMFHMVGAFVPLGAARTDHVAVVSILQAKGGSGFGADADAVLARILPHIRGAFSLREQVEAAGANLQPEALDAALDAFGLPAVVLDGHGTVLRTNGMAERIACVRQAMARQTKHHGVMRLPAGPDQKRWAASVAAAARGEAGGKFLLADEARSYLATITPLPARLAALTGDLRGRALLLLRPLQTQDGSALAATLFEFTEAETQVAMALVKGLSPAEIALARSVKVSTVRTLLQRAQDKADCRNLRDLVRLLASLD